MTIQTLSAVASSDVVEQYFLVASVRWTGYPWTAGFSGLLGLASILLVVPMSIKFLVPAIVIWGAARALVHEAAAAECLWSMLTVCKDTDVFATDPRLAGRHIPRYTISRATGLFRAIGGTSQLASGVLVDLLDLSTVVIYSGQLIAATGVVAMVYFGVYRGLDVFSGFETTAGDADADSHASREKKPLIDPYLGESSPGYGAAAPGSSKQVGGGQVSPI
eukprot:SAG31_NODE_6719_length_1912_cov_1.275786_3_plen_220_part_00